jgi:hypothetical protein
MAADLSKSLVHIQERYIAPGTIYVLGHDIDAAVIVPAPGVRIGDDVVVQPTNAAAVTAFGTGRILFSYVSDTDEVTVEPTGTFTGPSDLTVTVFGRGF